MWVSDSVNREFLCLLSHNFVANIWKNVTESTSMMFKQALDVDKVITQLLAGRKKTDKQVNMDKVRKPNTSVCYTPSSEP
jgi:hypothetical protein